MYINYEQKKEVLDIKIDSLYDNTLVNTISFLDFIEIFKEKTMIIYNGILMGKRILLVGYEKPIKDSIKIACTCQ